MTKISQNGQIVIPAEIRKDAGIKAFTKFLVFNEGGNILLRQIRKESLMKELKLIQKIEMTEKQIKKGKYVKANTSMFDEDIDDLLMK
ncbi:MAG: AbrB/MazE/SpoVT family DNA-binding domain-containing protein [Nanoarchaeota archaeon]|nr:AbrB/MazE/SpoVT family DNA-binding domain-containing protein [Nanoarchaeota archaeon]